MSANSETPCITHRMEFSFGKSAGRGAGRVPQLDVTLGGRDDGGHGGHGGHGGRCGRRGGHSGRRGRGGGLCVPAKNER